MRGVFSRRDRRGRRPGGEAVWTVLWDPCGTDRFMVKLTKFFEQGK